MLAEPWQRLSRIGRCAGRVYRMNHGKEEKKEKVQVSWADTFLPRWRGHGEAARDAD